MKIYKGFEISDDANINIIDKLIVANIKNQRVKITYKKGFGEWGGYSKIFEEIFCYVGRSTGDIKLLLDIRSKRSHGGCALLTGVIEKVEVV